MTSGAAADSAAPDAERASAPVGPLAALGVVDYRRFWFAAIASNTGGWMQNATIPFVIYQLTKRSSDVGITGFWVYLPMMIMSTAGGALADRFPRRRLLVFTQIAQGVFALALWALVASGRATPLSVSAVGFAGGLAGGLNIPIWQSFVAQLVPRHLLSNAVSLNSTQFNASRALGPLLAGVVVSRFSPATAFLVNALSFGAVLAVLPFIRAADPPRNDGPRPRFRHDLADGVRYVWGTPSLRACCIAIIVIAGLGNPLFSFLPSTFGQDVFAVRGWRLGLLSGIGGIGAVLIAPLLLTRGARLTRRSLLGAAMTGYGLGALVVGVAPTYWIAVAGALLWGGSYLAIATAINTTIQLVAREDMRGKAIAIYITCLTGALPVGTLLWGVAADSVGIRTTCVGAALCLLAATAWFIGGSRLRSLEAVAPTS